MIRMTNIHFTITIIALVAFSRTMKYTQGDSEWSLLKTLKSNSEITEGVHTMLTYTFVDIFDFAAEEKNSVKSQLEFLLNLDLETLYAEKEFKITDKEILMAEVEGVVRRNFKALATGAECNAKNEIYSLVKEYIQYQLYTQGWEVELNLEALYSDIMVKVNSQMDLLVQKLRQRVEFMVKIQADTLEQFNMNGEPMIGMKNYLSKFLIVTGNNLIKEITDSITTSDEDFEVDKKSGAPYKAIQPKISEVNAIIFKLKETLDKEMPSDLLNLLKQTVKDLYKTRGNFPLQAQRDFVSNVIYSLIGLAPFEHKLPIVGSALRNIESPSAEKVVKSPGYKPFKFLANSIPFEDVDLTDANIPALILDFDQVNSDGKYDPFNIELQPYVDRLLKLNSNFLNVPVAVDLFRLSNPQNVSVFQTLYNIIAKIRANKIDTPLSDDDIISGIIEQVNSGDWKTQGNELADILILLNIEADPTIDLSRDLLQYLNVNDPSTADLLNDDKFKAAVKRIFDAAKKNGPSVNGLLSNSGLNLLITKVGQLRNYEREYLANPANTADFLKRHALDLDSLYGSIEGSAHRGEELVVLFVNPKNSVCYEQSLKDYFSSNFI